jgi:cell division protein FtsB
MIVITGISLAIFFYVCLPSYSNLVELRKELAVESAKASEAVSKVAKLRSEKDALERDPLYLDQVVRTELRMVREGEVLP